MGQSIDLNKKKILEICGNEMMLTVSLGECSEVHVRVESEEGGRSIGIRPHDEDDQIVVFYLKDGIKDCKDGPQFRLI